MKKLLSRAPLLVILFLLFLSLGTGPALAAGDCPAAAPFGPAVSTPSSPASAVPASLPGTAPPAPALPPAGDGASAPQATAAGCLFRACMATPESCLCPGFYCNGQFVCGIPIQIH